MRRRRGAHLPRVLLHSIKLSPVLRLLKQILRSLQITLLLCGKLSRLVYLLLVLTHLLLHSLQRSLGLVSSLSLYLTHLGCLGQLPRCLRPGTSVTMARSSLRRALRRLDFPTLGLPTITAATPSR